MLTEVTPFTLFETFERDKNNVIKKRSLRFDLNALADFEQEVGMGFAQLMNTKAIFATTRVLLWAGLKHQERGLTVDRVGDLLTSYLRHGGSLTDALTAAFQAAVEQGAMGEPGDRNEPVPEKNVPSPNPVPPSSEGSGTGT